MSYRGMSNPWVSPGVPGGFYTQLHELTLGQLLDKWGLVHDRHSVAFFDDDDDILIQMEEWCETYVEGKWTCTGPDVTADNIRREIDNRILRQTWEPYNPDLNPYADMSWVHGSVALASPGLASSPGGRPYYSNKRTQTFHDVESAIAYEMADEIQKEIDYEIFAVINRHRNQFGFGANGPRGYIHFADPSEAVLFKLTWGGE